MKKILISLSAVAALAASMNVSATAIVSGGVITAASNCTMLTDDIKINLSDSVLGDYVCNTTTNTISVATCHTAGRNSPAATNNYIYSANSKGGSLAQTTVTGCTTSTVATQATAAASGS